MWILALLAIYTFLGYRFVRTSKGRIQDAGWLVMMTANTNVHWPVLTYLLLVPYYWSWPLYKADPSKLRLMHWAFLVRWNLRDVGEVFIAATSLIICHVLPVWLVVHFW